MCREGHGHWRGEVVFGPINCFPQPLWSSNLVTSIHLQLRQAVSETATVSTVTLITLKSGRIWRCRRMSHTSFLVMCFWVTRSPSFSSYSSELNWNRLFEAIVCSCFSYVFLYSHRNCGCCSVSLIHYDDTSQGMLSHTTQVNHRYTCGVCEYCVTPPRVVTNVGASYVSHPSVGCGNAPVP